MEPLMMPIIGILASALAGLLAYIVPRELGRVDRTTAKQTAATTDIAVVVNRVDAVEKRVAGLEGSHEANRTELHERVNRLTQRTAEHEKTTAEAIGELKGVMTQVLGRLEEIRDAERARAMVPPSPPTNPVDQLRAAMEIMTIMKQFKAA